jgi:hypothetical protein
MCTSEAPSLSDQLNGARSEHLLRLKPDGNDVVEQVVLVVRLHVRQIVLVVDHQPGALCKPLSNETPATVRSSYAEDTYRSREG